jgi:CHASE3 domain sensor protein
MGERDRSLASVPAPDVPNPRRRPRAPLGFEVLAGVGVLVAMLTVAILVAVFSILSLSEDQVQLQDRNVPYAVALATAALNAKGMANDERGFLINGKREFLKEFDQRLINVRTAFAEASIAADDDAQHRAVSEAHAGFERWVWAVHKEFKTFQSGDRRQATRAALGPGRELRKEYEASLTEAQAVATIAIQLRRNSFASSGWVVILLATLLAVLVIGFVVTIWLARTLNAVANAVEINDPTRAARPLLPPGDSRLRRREG